MPRVPDPARRLTATGGARRAAGVTLVELITTVSILGVVSVFAIPAFTRTIADQRVKSASTDFYIALSKARSEAIKRNTNVTVTATSGDWTQGWTIPQPNDTTKLLDSHGPLSGMTVSGPTSVTYQSSGRVSNATAPSFGFTSTVWSGAASCIAVDLSGRPYSKSSSC